VHRQRDAAVPRNDLLPDPPAEDQAIVAPYDLDDLNRSEGKRVSVRHVDELRPDGVGLD
jgi:hypothetical protein